MRRISITVIICLAIAVFGVHAGYAAEPIIKCGSDPMRIDIGDIIDCGVDINDTQNFYFDASSGDKIRLTMTDMTSGAPAPYLGLYDPGNVLIHQWYVQDSGSHRDYDLTKTGEYKIVVWEYADDQAVDFRIALQGINPSPPEARTLNHDNQLDGDIDPFADSDVFIFDGTNGDKIRLTMTDMTSGAPAPYLGLYDPDNVLIHQWYVQDSGSHHDYDLTKTGEYKIVVWEYADDQAVDFRIALQGINPSPPEARTLNHDNQLDGDIDPFADSDVFIFDGTNGDKIRLTMTDMTSGAPAPYLGLYDPDDVLIHQWYVQDSGSHRDYDLTKTGEYKIVVWEYADDQAVDFRIALQGINPSPPGTLTLCHDSQLDGDIDPFADSDVFIFNGTNGDKIRLTMTDMTSDAPAPYLGLYDPDNVLIHQWYVQNSGSHRDYDLTKTGEYKIVIWEYADDQAVDFKLGFNCISGDCFDECPLPDSADLFYYPVKPCRIVDTRKTSAGIIDANTQRNFRVHGPVAPQGGDSGGCSSPFGEPLAAHLNMVAVNPLGKGNLQAFPVGAGKGAGLSVNYNTIDTNLANAGTVKTVTGSGPDISVASNFSSAHTAIDVLGYYYPNDGFYYTPVNPCRIVDTRKTPAGIIDAGTERDFRVFGSVGDQGGDPVCPSTLGVDPEAAHINMVAVDPEGKGNLQAFPLGAGAGAGLSVNYNTIDTNLANAGTVGTVTGSGPDISVASNFSSAHTVLDVLGYYSEEKDLLYTPVKPCRIVDTRKTTTGIIDANTERDFRVFGSVGGQGGNPSGCPSPGGTPEAAHINMVAVNPLGKGNLQAFPVGAGIGAGLSVNYNTIDTNLANAGTVKTTTGTGPDITVASNFSSAHTVIDVLGYYYTAP